MTRFFRILAVLAVCPAAAECSEGHAAFKQFMEHEYLPLMKAQRLAAYELTDKEDKFRYLHSSRDGNIKPMY